MKPIPTPQLIKVSSTALGSVATPDHSHTLWEEFLRLQLKPSTRREYSKAINYFCQAMAAKQSPAVFLHEFLELPKKTAILLVLEWRQRLINEGKSSATINQRLSALKSLVEYALRCEACSYSLSEIKSLKGQPYKNTRGVPVEDYREILAWVDRTTDLGRRDYAILRLLWDNALRREEVVTLDLSDYLPKEGRLMILGKGQVDKESIDLNPQVIEALNEWIAFRSGLYFSPKNGAERDLSMFISCNGRRLAGSDIFRILKSYADLAEVQISPHRVRHSAITAYLDASDGNIRVAQSLSRHKDPRTLMIYDDNRQQLQRQATRELGDLLDDEVRWI
jgi:integrase/recombinase XerC